MTEPAHSNYTIHGHARQIGLYRSDVLPNSDLTANGPSVKGSLPTCKSWG